MKALDLAIADITVDKSPGKRDLAPGNGNCQPSIKEKVDEEAKKTRHTFVGDINAVASGVQARFEENTGYSRKVTETTINVARALGIPEAEIDGWAASRLNQLIRDMAKLREIKSFLESLQ